MCHKCPKPAIGPKHVSRSSVTCVQTACPIEEPQNKSPKKVELNIMTYEFELISHLFLSI